MIQIFSKVTSVLIFTYSPRKQMLIFSEEVLKKKKCLALHNPHAFLSLKGTLSKQVSLIGCGIWQTGTQKKVILCPHFGHNRERACQLKCEVFPSGF